MVYHNYIFLKSNRSLKRISERKRKQYAREFVDILVSKKKVIFYTYTTLGIKQNTDILIWFQSDKVENIQNLLNDLMHSQLGNYMFITYTLFGISRKTQYSPKTTAQPDTKRKGGSYLIIYPFTKTKEWYELNFKKRKKLMEGHMKIGRNYPQISQILLYSYGIDDNEFIVSYETDDLLSFQSLVMELRSDKVRAYTLRDAPIFTCVYKSPDEALNFL